MARFRWGADVLFYFFIHDHPVGVFRGKAQIVDQISALSILANYGRKTNDNVIYPYAAGCMTMGIFPFKETKSDLPKATLGLHDISARLYLKRMLKDDFMSFAVPFAMFQEMEANVAGSFLERHI